MARLFKHGRELLHLETDWRPSRWDDSGETESRVVRKIMLAKYADGDDKLTVLEKRQWRYAEAYAAEASWRDTRPHGNWKVYGVERMRSGEAAAYVADVRKRADEYDHWKVVK